MKAAPSTRAYEYATLSFGLINIPLAVYNGVVSTHGVKRREFISVPQLDDQGQPVMLDVVDDDGVVTQVPAMEDHPVGRMAKDLVTEQPLPQGTPVTRKIETEFGFVEVADHEIEQLFELDPKSIVVKAFQPRHIFDTGAYVPRSLYFVEAAKLKVGTKKMENKKAQQALGLVLAAMEAENAIAVVEFTTHGQPKPAILLPDGTLWLLYPTDAVREQRPLPELALAPAVVEQGRALIKSAWSETPLDLTDQRSALIQQFATEKAEAGDFAAPAAASEEPDVESMDGTDLLAMLTASVEQATG